jgi:polyhydroxybutyrate depolymerase
VNKSVSYTAAAFIGFGLVLLSAYAYFLYAPLPRVPPLSGHAKAHTMRIGTRVRQYIEYAPADLPAGAPLVIVLHGRLMNGNMMREMTGYEFDQAADREHFAVLYPDGYRRSWYDCRKDREETARLEHVDDPGFIRALIAKENADLKIDARKVFIVGFSNGGHMAMDLAEQSPSPAAAVAVFATSEPVRAESDCPQTTATPPVMIVDGTADPIDPFAGGKANIFGVQRLGAVMPVVASAEALAQRNGVQAAETTTDLPHRHADDPTHVRKMSWSRGGKPYVVLYEIIGGGHVVPQPAFRYPRLFGRTSQDIDGPKMAVAFFLHR